MQQAQGVVLVGDQAPHRAEGILILQRAVQDAPPQLVPAVGADVALGVELGEEVLVVGPPSTRSRSGVEPADDSRPTGLISVTVSPSWSRTAVRIASPRRPLDIHVSGLAAAVDDREHLVRGEETERRDRYRDTERDAEEHVIGVIDGQVHAGQAEQGYDHGSHDLGVGAGAARHDQAVHGTYEEDGQAATGGDGAEYPPQLAMMDMPYGRGRDRPL